MAMRPATDGSESFGVSTKPRMRRLRVLVVFTVETASSAEDKPEVVEPEVAEARFALA
jgi:hypothetical protein